MAIAEFTDFTRSVRDTYAESVSDGVLESNVIIQEIMRATGRPKEYDGIIAGPGGIWKNVKGSNFQWRVMKDELTAGNWGPGVGITPSTPELLQNASLAMGGYQVSYFVDRWEQMKLGGPTEYVPLIRLYEKMAKRRWESLFEQRILGDDNSNDGWKGLAHFMAQSGTYATNINLASDYATPYRFNYTSSGQTFDVTCLDRFREVCNQATHGDSQDGSDSPNVAFTGRTDWQKMCAVIEDSNRNINVDTDRLKRGFKNFTWNGVPVFWSDRMETDAIRKVYILNTHHLGVAITGNLMMESETAQSITGSAIGTMAVSFHAGQPFCGNTKKQGYIDNTNAS